VANPDPERPVLEAAYGAPGQAGHGSAVFYEPMKPGDDPDQAALAKYRYFIGEPRGRWGEEAWMGSCNKVYTRAAGTKPDIAAELGGINDPDTAGRRSPRASPCRDALLDVVEHYPEAEVRCLDWLTGDVDGRGAELAETMISRAAQ